MHHMHVQAATVLPASGCRVPTTAGHHGRPCAPLRADELRDLLLAPAGPLARVEVVERTGVDLHRPGRRLRRRPGRVAGRSVLVAEHQAAGRGRAGARGRPRPGRSLTCRFVVRPQVPADESRLAGAARRARRGQRPARDGGRTGDAQVAERRPGRRRRRPRSRAGGRRARSAGILAEVVAMPDGQPPAVVIGIGINVAQGADELPVPSATSLALAGAQHVDRDGLLVAMVAALRRARRSAGGTPAATRAASGLADEVAAVCSTLGAPVRVELPGGRRRERARRPARRRRAPWWSSTTPGVEHRVLAGDVRHVRTAG